MARALPAWIWPGAPGPVEIGAAVRATLCGVVPLALLLAAGRQDLIVYVAFPAFTSLYGRGEPYRQRAVTLLVAGAAFVSVVALAMLAAIAALPGWASTLLLAGLAAGGVLLSERMQWIPFGATFLVFAFAVVASVPVTPAQIPTRLGLAVATVGFCWTVAMAGLWLRRMRPAWLLPVLPPLRAVQRRPRAWRDAMAWWTAGEVALGVVVAIAVAEALGLGHAYWAAVTVAACIPRPHSSGFVPKIGHRVVGTALGVVVAGLVLGAAPPPWALVAAVGVFQFATELFVGRLYWLGTVFITPLALVVGHLAEASPLRPLLADRLFDTLVGGAVLLLVGHAGRPVARRLLQRAVEPPR